MAGHVMKSEELASMLKGQLKSNMDFKGIAGVDDPELHLSEEDIKWWRDAKIGLFIHWGIYSFVGKGEWSYFNEKIPEEDYRKIAEEEFIPKLTAKEIAEQWIGAAKDAGMNYAVMVTRHHDGFALWDSAASWKEFTSVKLGPKEDYVKAFTDECHKNNIYTGLYYSPMDWRFPGYFDPVGLKESAERMKEQAYKQLQELCTKYGKVDIVWYDGGWLSHKGTDADAAWFWEPIKLNKMLRSYQPKVMFTPRSGYKGDFQCDEGTHQVKGDIVPVPWEKCMSLSTAWGYIPGDKYLETDQVIRMLVDVICRDGNLLLNVGPDPNGRIPEEAKKVLSGIGAWLKKNGESVYGTRGGIWEPVDHVFGATYKENLVYLHVLNCEAFEKEVLSPIDKRIKEASLFGGEVINYKQDSRGVHIEIPERVIKEKRVDTIIRLTFDEIL